jgi:hypothetical protein
MWADLLGKTPGVDTVTWIRSGILALHCPDMFDDLERVLVSLID